MLRRRRHRRVRARIFGTAQRPRLSIFRSNRHLSAQLIDDEAQRTILALSDVHLGEDPSKGRGLAAARKLGELFGERARKAGIVNVVFDRGGFAYHGRVRAFAEGARKAGLEF